MTKQSAKLSALFRRCPKTGKIIGLRWDNRAAIWLLPVVGLLALLWYLVRVVPKPSRAHYPCQRIAAPLASGFLAWIAGFGAMTFFFRKARQSFRDARIFAAVLFLAAAVAALVWTASRTGTPVFAGLAKTTAAPPEVAIDSTHAVLGTARGTFPGRVVWVHDARATRQACTDGDNDWWWQDSNTDSAKVGAMLSEGLRRMTGTASDSAAWSEIFHYYNRTHGRGDVGYAAGETLFVKVNISIAYGVTGYSMNPLMDPINMVATTPQMMRALLRQLVYAAHIPQACIYIGDPMRPFVDQFYNLIRPEFTAVHYLDPWGTSTRTKAVATAAAAVFLSSNNRLGQAVSYKLPQQVVNAKYFINLGCLKGHDGAGITVCAKNNYGNHAFACTTTVNNSLSFPCWGNNKNSDFLHFSLPSTGGMYLGTPGMGHYRALVDLMGHKDLDGKCIVFIADGLWGAASAVAVPEKWKTAPFGNQYSSTILVSQDEVALESVGFDILRTEYHYANGYDSLHCYPNTLFGCEDYIHQAADPTKWAAGITYDPEKDGTPLTSLGAHEHWNNPTAKKYSRNLDPVNGKGIELVFVDPTDIQVEPNAAPPQRFDLRRAMFDRRDAGFVIELPQSRHVTVRVVDVHGRQIAVLADRDLTAGRHAVSLDRAQAAGEYFCVMQAGSFVKTVAFQQAR